MTAPRIGPRQLVYQNPYQQVLRVDADFGAFSKQYFVTEVGSRAGLVLADQHRILLVRQYRFLLNTLAWEIPGGRIDDGESPAQAVTRELLEETGIRCLNPQPLLFFHPGLDSFHNPSHLFSAHQHQRITPFHPNPREVVDLAWIPLDDCLRMIFQGQILDSLSITGLLAFHTLQTQPQPHTPPTHHPSSP